MIYFWREVGESLKIQRQMRIRLAHHLLKTVFRVNFWIFEIFWPHSWDAKLQRVSMRFCGDTVFWKITFTCIIFEKFFVLKIKSFELYEKSKKSTRNG